MAGKEIKKAVAKSDEQAAAAKGDQRKFTLVRPESIYITKAINGYTIDPQLEGNGVWVAKDEKELGELVGKLFSGIPAHEAQPQPEEIIEE